MRIEESTAMRKLIRIGFETYIGNLYKGSDQGSNRHNSIFYFLSYLAIGIKADKRYA